MKTTAMMVFAAAAGTAAILAYSSMKPAAKNQLKQDFKETARDMGDVKDKMCDVRHDVTEMAGNLKNQI